MSLITEKIIAKLNIVDVVSTYLNLHKKGKNYWGVCPFHNDTKPSLSVSSEKQIFKCFSCGKGGNLINFVADYEKISYGKSLEKLAEKAGIEYQSYQPQTINYSLQQEKLINVLKDASIFFQYAIDVDHNNVGFQYAKKRNLDQQTREKFAIGYSPQSGLYNFLKEKGHDEADMINASLIDKNKNNFFKERLMFPIKNELGDVIAFSGRTLKKDESKYINSSESQVFQKSKILYNINNAQNSLQKTHEVFLCEGFMDVIALEKMDYSNSVAIMGVALTNAHIQKLKGVVVTLILDSDTAGIQASLKSIKILQNYKITTQVVEMPINKDPDSVLESEGKQKLQSLLLNKISALDFVYKTLKNTKDVKTFYGLEQFISEFAKFLNNSNDLEKDFYINKLVQEFQMRPESIVQKIFKNKSQQKAYSELTAPPIKIKPDEKPTNFYRNNYYLLIRSMLKKPMLVDILKKNPVQFTDSILLGIVKYIAAHRKGQKIVIDEKYQNTILQIQQEDDAVIKTTNEFKDLIHIINKQSTAILKQNLQNKLIKTTSSEEKIIYLEQLRKINKGKKRN